jgi:hypothetical protein
MHIPRDKRPPGMKLSPRAQRGIFIGYTNVNHHYRVFLPEESRTAVSGDVFFPPHKSEGANAPAPSRLCSLPLRQPSISPPVASPTTSVTYPLNKEEFPTNAM